MLAAKKPLLAAPQTDRSLRPFYTNARGISKESLRLSNQSPRPLKPVFKLAEQKLAVPKTNLCLRLSIKRLRPLKPMVAAVNPVGAHLTPNIAAVKQMFGTQIYVCGSQTSVCGPSNR
jgi:hypothetical protein